MPLSANVHRERGARKGGQLKKGKQCNWYIKGDEGARARVYLKDVNGAIPPKEFILYSL